MRSGGRRAPRYTGAVAAFAIACGAGAVETPPTVPAPVVPPSADQQPDATEAVAEPAVASWPVTLLPVRAARDHAAVEIDAAGARAVVLASSGHVVVFDVATGLTRFVSRRARRIEPWSVVVLPAAAIVGYIDADGSPFIERLDLVSGEFLTSGSALVSEAGAPLLVASRDRTTSAAALDDSSIRIERADGATSVCPVDRSITQLLVSTDGRLLACAGPAADSSSTDVAILDGRDCAERARFTTDLPDVRLDALTADGLTLVAWNRTGAHVLDAASGVERFVAAGVDFAVSPDDRALVPYEIGADGSRRTGGSLDLRDGHELGWSAAARDASLPLHARLGDTGVVTVRRGGQLIATLPPYGGEHSIHGVDAGHDGLVVREREGTVYLSGAGSSPVDCLDERNAEWEARGRWLLSAGGGRCDPRTNEGAIGSATESEGYDYDPSASPVEEDAIVCGERPTAPCLHFPSRGAPYLLDGERHQPLSGARDVVDVTFSPDDVTVAGWSDSVGVRLFSTRTRRVTARLAGETQVIDWSPDGRWLVVNGAAGPRVRTVDGRAFPLLIARPEAAALAFSPDSSSLYYCAGDGTLRGVALTSGAERVVAPLACTAIAMIDERTVAVVAAADTRTIVRVDGTVVGTMPTTDLIGASMSLASPWLLRCTADGLEVFDAATLALRHRTAVDCDQTGIALDGSYVARRDDEEIVLTRADGVELRVHVLDARVAVAWSETGAYAVGQPDALARIVVREEGPSLLESRLSRGDDPETQRRFYRPSLFADFFAGRPLAVATP